MKVNMYFGDIMNKNSIIINEHLKIILKSRLKYYKGKELSVLKLWDKVTKLKFWLWVRKSYLAVVGNVVEYSS